MPNRIKDDRPFMDRLTSSPTLGGATRDSDVELSNKGKRDPRLPSGGPLEGLREAAKGLKTLKDKGLF